MMKHAIAIAVCGLVSACNGGASTPTSPSPPPPANIAGDWTGTLTFTPFTGGQRLIIAVTASMTQSGANVTGQLNTQFTDGTRGTLSGTMSGTQLQATISLANNAGCEGSASISGSVTSGTLRWTIPTVASPSCNWFTNADVVLNR